MKLSDVINGLSNSVIGVVSGVIKLPIAIATEVAQNVKSAIDENKKSKDTSSTTEEQK